MAKRSYLDNNANYRSAKRFMRGMSIEDQPESLEQKNRLIGVIRQSPTLENLHRQWSKGMKDEDGYDKEPTMPFDQYVEKKWDASTKNDNRVNKWNEPNPRDSYLTPEQMYKDPRGTGSDARSEQMEKLKDLLYRQKMRAAEIDAERAKKEEMKKGAVLIKKGSTEEKK